MNADRATSIITGAGAVAVGATLLVGSFTGPVGAIIGSICGFALGLWIQLKRE